MVDIEHSLNTLLSFTEKPRLAQMGLMLSIGFFILTVITAVHSWQHNSKIGLLTLAPSSTPSERDILLAASRRIPSSHIFGLSTTILTDELPITALPLRLVGLIQSVPPSESSAIIATDKDDPGKSYRIDDTLPGEARLLRITQNGIVLDNHGHSERLPLRRSTLSFQAAPTPLPLKDH